MKRLLASFLVALIAASGVFVALLPTVPAAQSAAATPYRSTPERTFYDADGTATSVEKLNVELAVTTTSNLRGSQQVSVSWSGAHPTGGIATDPNAGSASRQEYPFVLLQCRGEGAQITPETCWTSTAEERYQRSNPESFAWSAWRSDAKASAAERAAFVGRPAANPKGCEEATFGAERWVPFVTAAKRSYAGGPAGCAGLPPEASAFGDVGMPSNTTYGVTGTDGRGSARFSIWTADENSSLGCSVQVACSLVAVPIVGLSCDAWGTLLPGDATRPTGSAATRADGYCRGSDKYAAGELARPGLYNLATSGQLWWSASNWSNRITVPLSFAVSSHICGIVNHEEPMSVLGSVLFNEISAQWMPKFCTTKGFSPFVHVQASDSAARNLITAGTASVVLGSAPAEEGYARPVVQAPVAVSGFGIGFNIDKADGSRLATLNLNARLVVKLLTQSYPATSGVKGAYPALSKNPLNITLDPEFRALNPDAPRLGAVEAASTILTLNTNADMMWALTSWIDQDIEARDFLNGVPDPWDMRVNPSYRRLELPVAGWTLLDEFTLANDTVCYNYSPSPYLGLVANPIGQLSVLLQDLQYAISNVATACPADAEKDDPTSLRLRTQGRQIPGHRFVLGVVPLTAASRYGFDVARLQTTSSVPLADTFDSAEGRSFVAPDVAGLKAGAALLAPDTAAGLWTLPYAALRSASGEKAYPGTMPVFAVVPTTGLPAATATRAAQFLAYAAGPGQVSGFGTGQLPAGTLPLTKSSGLGAFAAYTACAARAVAAQRGDVPVVGSSKCQITAPPSAAPTPTPAPTTVPGPVPPVAPAVSAPDLSVPPAGLPVVAAPAATSAAVTVPLDTVAASTGFGRFGVPAAGFLMVLLAVFGALTRWGEVASVRAAAWWVRSGRRIKR